MVSSLALIPALIQRCRFNNVAYSDDRSSEEEEEEEEEDEEDEEGAGADDVGVSCMRNRSVRMRFEERISIHCQFFTHFSGPRLLRRAVGIGHDWRMLAALRLASGACGSREIGRSLGWADSSTEGGTGWRTSTFMMNALVGVDPSRVLKRWRSQVSAPG
ncbi:hypothetical protein AXG93_3960s1050 [Marchantia polymorpha subsp. ruderalis]|uniref:Uncharacterized protein n=1 Tax=Marchantia polymorpha subsp. ruderalis TaxID=1480154 RepID=A0A176VKB9_MARPO|nr:hypothetical protein AXG93_3960s1050 [Marchantia polymorpha subsp. ruderalis]